MYKPVILCFSFSLLISRKSLIVTSLHPLLIKMLLRTIYFTVMDSPSPVAGLNHVLDPSCHKFSVSCFCKVLTCELISFFLVFDCSVILTSPSQRVFKK